METLYDLFHVKNKIIAGTPEGKIIIVVESSREYGWKKPMIAESRVVFVKIGSECVRIDRYVVGGLSFYAGFGPTSKWVIYDPRGGSK